MTKSLSAAKQQQFLDVIDRDEAERRWREAINVGACGQQRVPLESALGRVLAREVISQVDVPGFDRSNLDGFAVRAADTYGADEEHARKLRLLEEVIAPAIVPHTIIAPGDAVTIATGGMLPRGADAIVMVEHTEVAPPDVLVFKPVTPGRGVTFAGTDIARGETVYRPGDVLTSRETGVLAAIGIAEVDVYRRPQVGIISTGDEIIRPGGPIEPGQVYDSNARVLADAVQELGGVPLELGIVPDDIQQLRHAVANAIQRCHIVLLSGGTSKGEGDLSYQVIRELDDPGIVAHGVALKPGKPICLAASRGKPIVILPGFPTSAIFTFHEFVAPVIRTMAGQPLAAPSMARVHMAMQVNSEIGRTEYLLVGLVKRNSDLADREGLAAYPMGKGSGSVTTFARADGFVTIDRHEEIVAAGSPVNVTLLGRGLMIADLVVIGSHCIGLDYLLGRMQQLGVRTKFLAVGSTAGLQAIQRGECDVAGTHLLDPTTNTYNRPFLSDGLELVRGYSRQQGIVFRQDDARFRDLSVAQIRQDVVMQDDCVMVNRNQGSGTRILIDGFLDGAQPSGYPVQSRSHNAVAASVAQRRSDWGVTIEEVARQNSLGFLPIRAEEYDFVVRSDCHSRALEQFRALLLDEDVRQHLHQLGLRTHAGEPE